MEENSPLTDADLARPARHLPLKIIRGLGNQLHRPLNAGGNWEILAEELGFETEDVKRINATANVRQEVTPGELLLCAWREQRGSGYTLFALRNALIQVDRHDCVEYLESEVYKHVVHMDLKVCVRDESYTGSINHLQVRTKTDSTLLASLQNVLQQPITSNYIVLDHGASWQSAAREFKGRQLMLQKTNNVEPMPLDQDPTVDSSSIVDTANSYDTNNSITTVSPTSLPAIQRTSVGQNSPQGACGNTFALIGQSNLSTVTVQPNLSPEINVYGSCFDNSKLNQSDLNRPMQTRTSDLPVSNQNDLNFSARENGRERNTLEACNIRLNIGRNSRKLLNNLSADKRQNEDDARLQDCHMQENLIKNCIDNRTDAIDDANGTQRNEVSNMLQSSVHGHSEMENAMYGRNVAVENSVTSWVESKKDLSGYEFHRHLEPFCTQPSGVVHGRNNVNGNDTTPKALAVRCLKQSQTIEDVPSEPDNEMMDSAPVPNNIHSTMTKYHSNFDPTQTDMLLSEENYQESFCDIHKDDKDNDDYITEYQDSEHWLDRKREDMEMEVFTQVTEVLDPELEMTLQKELFQSATLDQTGLYASASSSESDKELVDHCLSLPVQGDLNRSLKASNTQYVLNTAGNTGIDNKPLKCKSVSDVKIREREGSEELRNTQIQARINSFRPDILDTHTYIIEEQTHDDCFGDAFYEKQGSYLKSGFDDSIYKEQSMTDERKDKSMHQDDDNEQNNTGNCSYIDFDKYPQDFDETGVEFYLPDTNQVDPDTRQSRRQILSGNDRHADPDHSLRYGYESLQRHVSCPANMYGTAQETSSPLPTIADVFTPVTDEPRSFGIPIEDIDESPEPTDIFKEDHTVQKRHRADLPRCISLQVPRRANAFKDQEKKAFRHTFAEGHMSTSTSRDFSEFHRFRSSNNNLDIIDLPPPLPHRKSKVISHPYKVVVGRRPSSQGTDSMLAGDKLFAFYNGKLKGHLGWSPLETEFSVEKTMKDVVHQDGFYILWYNRTKRNLMITVRNEFPPTDMFRHICSMINYHMACVARTGTFGTFKKVKIKDAVVDQDHHFLAHLSTLCSSDHGKNIHVRVHSKVLDNHLFFYVIRDHLIKDVRQLLKDCIEQGLSIRSTRMLGTRQEVDRKVWMRCPVIVEYERKPAVSV